MRQHQINARRNGLLFIGLSSESHRAVNAAIASAASVTLTIIGTILALQQPAVPVSPELTITRVPLDPSFCAEADR